MEVAVSQFRSICQNRSLIFGLGILFLLALTPYWSQVFGGSYVVSLIMKAMIFAIASLSLNLLIGYGGLVSFGHAAFLGLGSYVTGILITEGITDAIVILPMVLTVSGLFALITGAISLRTSGVYFIMITLAFGQMLFFSLSSLANYGGDDGLTLWDTATFFDTTFFQYDGGLFYAVLIILTLCWGFVSLLSGSRFGRVLRAAKQNKLRVETMGFKTFQYQLLAYVISGMIAGIAGFLFACQAEFVSPAIATWQRSGDLIIMVVLGGMATRNGPLLGALFFILVEESLSLVLHEWRLIFGPLLVVIVLFANGGLVELLRRLRIRE